MALRNFSSTMSELASAAANNNLLTIRHVLSDDKGQLQPREATAEMQDVCVTAALANHPAAVELLMDRGCWTSPDVICAALEGKSKDVFDLLMSKGWDVNLDLGHMGDALM